MPLRPWNEELDLAARQHWAVHRSANGDEAYERLADLLSLCFTKRIPAAVLVALSGSDNRARSYKHFSLKKKRGGERSIAAPKPQLKWVQRALLHALSHLYVPHKCAHGFVREHSIVTHASVHLNRRWLFVTDIKDFFPSIHWGRVYRMLQRPPFSAAPDVARIIANLSCHEGALPQGSPTSPFLANMICRRMDHRLYRYAKEHGLRYSRYADDLAFSTYHPTIDESNWQAIEKIVNEEQFEINPEKRRFLPAGRRQIITGVIVNGKQPSVKREIVRNLRALLHNVIRYGWESQLRRIIAIHEFADIAKYRNRTLPLTEVRTYQAKQRQEHWLLNPVTVSADDVPTLQKIVQGKLAFVAQVKGKDSLVYRSLDQLAVQAFGDRHLIADDLYGPDYYLSKEAKRALPYFEELVLRAESLAALREVLMQPAPGDPVEFAWILPPREEVIPAELAALKRQVLATKRAAIFWNAIFTSYFFKHFVSDGYFTALLQGPEPDANQVSFWELWRRAAQLFRQCEPRLPAHLASKVDLFLKQCQDAGKLKPTIHLWADQAAREEILLPFKRATRFDEDPIGATDLVDMLDGLRAELRAELAERVDLLKVDIHRIRPILTDVEAVREGLRLIIQSILSRTAGQEVNVNSEALDERPGPYKEYRLLISDPAAVLLDQPDVAAFFDGPLRKAVSTLRGYIDWHVLASFPDGHSYEFNIMRNSRRPLEKDAPGLRHVLTFYRYAP